VPPSEPLILIVDDDPIMRTLVRAALEGDGFAVAEAGDGVEACLVFADRRPDLLLVDVVMPQMDGFGLCRELRRRPSSARVPILMATGLDDVASITAAYEAGATDFISKPINWLILSHRIRYMLRAGHAFDAAQRANEALEMRVEERTAELRAMQTKLLQQERLSMLGQLTATVAHELRNPLGAIKNTLVAMKDAGPSGALDSERAMERMERCIGRCNKIITDLIDYTHAPEVSREPVHLDLWLDALLDAQPMAADITLERRLGMSGRYVEIDAERLRRAVLNVLENAVQAVAETAAGERRIIITTRSSEAAEIIIADTGPGIAGDVLDKIFEPLFSTKSIGAGMGLATVKQIVDQHGGTIAVTSAPGRGASVRIALPLAGLARAAA
jgi:signal transduction histidine kinase